MQYGLIVSQYNYTCTLNVIFIHVRITPTAQRVGVGVVVVVVVGGGVVLEFLRIRRLGPSISSVPPKIPGLMDHPAKKGYLAHTPK